jgi:DNA mismatch repair protein MutS
MSGTAFPADPAGEPDGRRGDHRRDAAASDAAGARRRKARTPASGAPRMTPMMAQWHEMKATHADALLLFRMGDFYELFFDDAKDAAKILGLTLTRRGQHGGEPIPMAGVPWHSVSGYIRRLVDAGRRVAICDQVEDPKKAKGIVKRAVTEVVTAGTMLSDAPGEERENRFVAAIVPAGDRTGLALADLGTGELLTGELPLGVLADELVRYAPREVVLPAGVERPAAIESIPATHLDAWAFARPRAHETLTRHLGTQDLSGFGCEDLDAGVGAAGGLLRYLVDLKGDSVAHFTSVRRLAPTGGLFLDAASLRNLEVLDAPAGGWSLRETIDRTATAMGARFLRAALARPLVDVGTITARQDAVERFVRERGLRDGVREELEASYDLERLAGRLGTLRAGPRDLVSLRRTLERLPALKRHLDTDEGRLGEMAAAIDPLEEVTAELSRALVEEPPVAIAEGGAFREGYAAELDEVRRAAHEGRAWIAGLEKTERERTGIGNLKVGFNKVFGYYIEVTKANLARVPESYQRKQTLVGAERFVTEELKQRESAILGADERLTEMETALFGELRSRVAEHLPSLVRTARSLAEIDFLCALAVVAAENGYVRPEVHEGEEIRIRGGRHPVVEHHLVDGEFVPNDVELHPDAHQILLITGPNMAGKSTYLRQVGLIVLLAQVGSFVPVDSASIGVADRIFTRVGAGDNIARGQSTFLVEMHESANILHNATSRSLVLLDEVGRGTSTFDGLSIAWAITEHLHDGMRGRPRTLFATHFHELTRLAERLPRVANFRVEVKEWEGRVVFLRKIVEGRADRSYGIHVAEMAGVPGPVIARAREILDRLEAEGAGRSGEIDAVRQGDLFGAAGVRERAPRRAPVDEAARRVREALAAIDPENLTPLQALVTLAELRRRLGDDATDAPGAGPHGGR